MHCHGGRRSASYMHRRSGYGFCVALTILSSTSMTLTPWSSGACRPAAIAGLMMTSSNVNSWCAGDLRHHRAHYEVAVMYCIVMYSRLCNSFNGRTGTRRVSDESQWLDLNDRSSSLRFETPWRSCNATIMFDCRDGHQQTRYCSCVLKMLQPVTAHNIPLVIPYWGIAAQQWICYHQTNYWYCGMSLPSTHLVMETPAV